MTAPRTFAVVGLGLTIAGVVATAIVRYVAPAPFIAVGFGYDGTTMVGFLIEGLCWASIGALVVVRRPENAVGWLMVLVGVGHALSQLSVALAFAFAAEGTANGQRLAQIAGWATVLLQLVGVFQIAIGFLYPNGRVQSRAWARFMWSFWAFVIVFVVISLSQPGPLQLVPALENPFGIGPDLRGDRPMAPIFSLLTIVIFGSLGISMISRYRSAGTVERLQLKWFVLALGVSAIGLGFATSGAIVMSRPTNSIGLTVYVLAGAFVPVAIGIAILRYRLYAIDRIISRTIAYATVSAITAIVFGGAIVLLSSALASFIEGETIAVAGSTLAAFAVFQPLLRRVRRDVDRRFNRAHYDAEETVAGFAARLRDEVDIGTVTTDLHWTVQSAVSPSSLGLWIREARP
jgi:O-antigen/teichoic acid export membrane protein